MVEHTYTEDIVFQFGKPKRIIAYYAALQILESPKDDWGAITEKNQHPGGGKICRLAAVKPYSNDDATNV